jgi:hypothetical protein
VLKEKSSKTKNKWKKINKNTIYIRKPHNGSYAFFRCIIKKGIQDQKQDTKPKKGATKYETKMS